MFRILIAEDEKTSRCYLSEVLSKKYDIEVAENGSRALRVGARFKPDLLITDWMLRDRVHGIQVSRAPQRIMPELQTILVTGFPSGDLHKRAKRAGIECVLSKPFDFDELHRAVEWARQKAARISGDIGIPSLGLIEFTSDGRIGAINKKAQALLTAALLPKEPGDMSEIFAAETLSSFHTLESEWREICPTGQGEARWLSRYRYDEPSQTAMLMLLDESESLSTADPTVKLIVDVMSPQHYRWPLESRAIVIDDEEMFRDVIVTQLEIAGCVCHAAGSYDEALRLFEADEGIEVAILDYEMPDRTAPYQNITNMIARMKSQRSGLVLVGNSGNDYEEEFMRAGADMFLRKPWRIDLLINMLGKTPALATGFNARGNGGAQP